MRTCARSGCSAPAAAILTYDRGAQTAYLYSVDVAASRSPGDLCERHLNRLVLPRSWQLHDRRDLSPDDVAAEQLARRDRRIDAGAGAVRPRAAARPAAARGATRRKWAEAGPSLFDAPATDVSAPVATAPVVTEPVAEPATKPVWMPRFGPETDLDDVFDAKTPLLRRAFGGR